MKTVTKILITIIALFAFIPFASAQGTNVRGRVLNKSTLKPIVYANIIVEETALYTFSDNAGNFILEDVASDAILTISNIGYETEQININQKSDTIIVYLQEATLKIKDVVVTAKNISNVTGSTSYSIGRNAIDHVQPLSVADIMSLLPGGKSRGDVNLANSTGTITLRTTGANSSLSAFGTAIEVDGVRMSNNASYESVGGFETRSLQLSNIQAVEVVSGIAGVEYGDISSGVVKLKTRKGKTPLSVEALIRPNTKQFSAAKGFSIGENGGVLNLSGEYAKSISDLASPYTSYTRGAATANYLKFWKFDEGRSFLFDMSTSVNIGGYNNEEDPDNLSENYTKSRDDNFRTNIKLRYLPHLSWLSKVEFSASANYSNQLTTTNSSESSAASVAAIHVTEAGYHIATTYDPDVTDGIKLIEPGYWYELSYYDSKPLYLSSKLTAVWDKEINDKITNHILVGGDYSGSVNFGEGLYYDDMMYAPTYRPYRFADNPMMHNFSAFVQEDFKWEINDNSFLDIMAGLRYDLTYIKNSTYGTVGNASPRFNVAYTTLKRGEEINNLRMYASWGRGVKLPSFAMLYPQTTYSDKLAFSPGADANNTAFVAYYTNPQTPTIDPDLKWQYTDQLEFGFSVNLWGNRVSMSAFYSNTKNTYTSQYDYTPYAFKLTTQEHLTDCPIAFSDRLYAIDQTTGVVTISDVNGIQDSWVASYNERQIYNSQSFYTNGSPLKRYGLEWAVDFARIKPLSTTVRIDGNYLEYKSVQTNLVQGTSSYSMSSGDPYQYIGYYVGASSLSNGSHSKELNLNVTLNTHIPKIAMVFSLKFESTLKSYSQYLSTNAYTIANTTSYDSTGGDIYAGNSYTAAMPKYYSTWENPDELIPFAETFEWAKINDETLYNDLSKLLKISSTNYYFKPQTVTPYYSVNLSATKEIGKHTSISFYATNFLNNISTVESSWGYSTGTLYNSSYIPLFYYGVTLRIKL